ncbi:MAG: class I tRNA ligase family protein, partial [Gemmobacter sp.]
PSGPGRPDPRSGAVWGGGRPPRTPALVPLVEAKKIMQPFGDRSKVVIEPMLTDQWFVDTARIVQPAIDAVRGGDTVILPERDAKVYFHWLENIEPWCISRQLWWGHQIPVWYGPDGEPFCANSEEDAVADAEAFYEALLSTGELDERFADNGEHIDSVSVSISNSSSASLPSDAAGRPNQNFVSVFQNSAGCAVTLYLYRDPDVLDTWFSSGLWPIGTLGWPEQTPELQRYFPTSTLITGFDIIFFWVARMMMMQLAVVDQVPFRTVYVHALVRDEKGKKMSKSLGNVLDPLDLIDEYGADAVRFTLTAMAAMGRDLKLSKDRIAGYRNFGTKLWNACRFAEMNGVWEGHATQPAPPVAQATANRWIIGEVARTLAEVDAALTEYRFDQAADALYRFVWGQVCDWYVEFAKPLLDGPEAQETRQTMAWVLDRCMILLHPMMPFVTEELWATTGTRAKPLALTAWPDTATIPQDADAQREMAWVTGLIDDIRSARAQMHIAAGLKLDLLAIGLDDAGRAAFARNEALIRRLARIDSVTDAPAVPKGAITLPVEGGLFALPLAGVIDVTAEAARLTKALEKLEKDMTALRARLANPQFLASAKEEVVDEARARLETGEDEAAKLRAALARLAELG